MATRIETFPAWGTYDQLNVRYEPEADALWCRMDALPRPCFNPGLLSDIKRLQESVTQINRMALSKDEELPVRYFVATSATPGVFNLGGDLTLFTTCIRERRPDLLRRYAEKCIDVLFVNSQDIDRNLTTISLVQGEALGGGFEAAISSSVVIAEESSTFGLPEVLFNLFPGMGAYSFLARRISPAIAERLILTGDVFTARQMYDLGVVDEIAPDGEGEKAVRDFIRRHARRRNTHAALRTIREQIHPVTRTELDRIAEVWVETALKLEEKDLRMMERLGRAQDRRVRRQEESLEIGTPLAEPRALSSQSRSCLNSREILSV